MFFLYVHFCVSSCRNALNLHRQYGGTAAMLVDAAYCLAMRQQEIEQETGRTGGYLTPYLAMGEALRKQLEENAWIHWGWSRYHRLYIAYLMAD